MNVSEVSSMLRHSLRNDSSRESTLQNQSLLSIASLKSIPAQNYSNDSKEFLLASLSSSSLSTSKTNGFPIETFSNSIEMKTNEMKLQCCNNRLENQSASIIELESHRKSLALSFGNLQNESFGEEVEKLVTFDFRRSKV